jgi:exodeoxyribonuclease VII small subunit
VTERVKRGGDEAEREETLEGRLRRLEQIMGQLESDEVDLEKALALFEEGVALVREAEAVLSRTQLRVEELLAGGRTAPFSEAEDEEDGGA